MKVIEQSRQREGERSRGNATVGIRKQFQSLLIIPGEVRGHAASRNQEQDAEGQRPSGRWKLTYGGHQQTQRDRATKVQEISQEIE